MQGIYSYIPETNRVSTVYSVAAVMYLQFIVHVMLLPMLNFVYLNISTFHSMCAVPNMAVCCNYLISCFSCTLLRYVLNNHEMVLVAPVITGIAFVFTFHIRCVSVVRSLYFNSFRLLS